MTAWPVPPRLVTAWPVTAWRTDERPVTLWPVGVPGTVAPHTVSDVTAHGNLLAISDLHVGYAENREHVERLRPVTSDDWLLVAGDVGELVADVEWALDTL